MLKLEKILTLTVKQFVRHEKTANYPQWKIVQTCLRYD